MLGFTLTATKGTIHAECCTLKASGESLFSSTGVTNWCASWLIRTV